MILLTTLRGDRFGLNPDLIEEIRANGTSCVVTMITGRSYTAAEDIDTVESILLDHRVSLLHAAAQGAGEPAHHRAHLAPVPDAVGPDGGARLAQERAPYPPSPDKEH